MEYLKESKKEKGSLITSIKAGIASKNTPLDYKFHLGSYTKIPLRAHPYNYAGDSFYAATFEYHRDILIENFSGIIFVDSAKIVDNGYNLSQEKLMTDVGLGISYMTPIGLPLRADMAYNIRNDNYSWNIALGHSY